MSLRVLFTGAGGFIGANCVEWLLRHTDWMIVAIDSFRHKGTCSRLEHLLDPYRERLKVFRHDLAAPISQDLEERLLRSFTVSRGRLFDYVVNMASDSHVTRSIYDPLSCWRNNCELIANMLEFARRHPPRRFLQISTDEVYGDVAWDAAAHPEWSTVLPSNPYSASKAAQEALAISYWRTYETPLLLVNIMNVFGERQDPEKFVPKVIGAIRRDELIRLHSDEHGRYASRVWLDVQDLADALSFILRHAPLARYRHGTGETRPTRYNVVGDCELDVRQVVEKIARCMGRESRWTAVRGDDERPGYDRRYALDGSKLSQLGWSPAIRFEDTVQRLVDFSQRCPEWFFHSPDLQDCA